MGVRKSSKLANITMMLVTFGVVGGVLFLLMNSATSGQGEVTGATTMEAPINGAAIGEAVAPSPETAECDFAGWVGKSAGEAEEAAKETKRAYRMLPPGAMMTMDYRADRINIETDGKGDDAKVTKVSCG